MMGKNQYLMLAAVVASVLLSAGEASAELQNGPAICDGLGIGITCLPSDTDQVLDQLFTVSDNDPLFQINADETVITLTFPDPVTGSDLEGTGFRLSGLQSIPALVEGEITDVVFIDFADVPSSNPFVTNDNGTQTIQWTNLAGADPMLSAVARINLQFVPEPGTAALLGLSLAGLCVVRRSRREESERTA